MKYNAWQPFDNELKQGSPSLVLLLIKDEFELKEALKSVKKRFKDVRLIEAEELEQELSSFSLFSKASSQVIERIDELKAGDLEILEAAISAPNRQSALIMTATTLPAALTKKIETLGLVLEIGEVKPWEKQARVQDWICRYVAKDGRTIHREAAFILAREYVGDRFLLKEELDKLLTYAIDKKEITLPDVQAIVTMQEKSVLWNLSDAVLQKNGELALTILKGLEGSDTHTFQVLRYLRNQLHNAVEMASLHQDGVHHEDIMKRFPQMRGKAFEKQFEAACKFGKEACLDAMIQVDTLEVELKNVQKDAELSLEMLLIRITS